MSHIRNLTSLMRARVLRGMVLMLRKSDGKADMDSESQTARADKRPREEAQEVPEVLLIANGPSSYTPLPEDQTTREMPERKTKRVKKHDWQPVTIGHTTILQDASPGVFKCPRTNCPYTHANSSSVIIHYSRHCIKQENSLPTGTPQLLVSVASAFNEPDDEEEQDEDIVDVDGTDAVPAAQCP